ncbi:uncharacterized protein LOC116256322 [Nymphaea colorata]|nr:uncharacterized protein LOC116256322 [Nymphaea colorata]
MDAMGALIAWLRKTDNVIHVGLTAVFGTLAFRSATQQQQIELLQEEKGALQKQNKTLKSIMWHWKQELFREASVPGSPISLPGLKSIYGEAEVPSSSSPDNGGGTTNSASTAPKFVV